MERSFFDIPGLFRFKGKTQNGEGFFLGITQFKDFRNENLAENSS